MRLYYSLLSVILLPLFSFGQTQRIDSLKTIVAQQAKDTTYFATLTRIGIDYERIDSKQAIYYFRKNIEESGKNQDNSTALAALRLAGVYSTAGMNDSTDYFFKLAADIVEKYPEHIRLKADYHTAYGIHLNRIGNRWEALAQYDEVSKLDTSIINRSAIAGNYLNISNVYAGLDMTKERLDAVFKSLAIFEEIQNQLGISFCYNGLGNIYYNQKDYAKAKEWHLKSLKLREQLENKPAIAVALNNLGNVAMDTERYDEALDYFQRAMEINKSMNYQFVVADNHINIGKVYQKKDELDNALFHLTEAKNSIEGLPGTPNIPFILAEIGRIYSQMGQNQRAETTLKEALKIAQQRNSISDKAHAYSLLKDHYERVGQYKQAFEAQTHVFRIKDSLESQELKLKINNLESKYEFGKKEAEVELLKAERERDQLLLEKQRGRQFVIFLVLVFVVLTAVLLINRYRLLNRERRRIEMEKMRLNIAQDLHDDVGSTLSGIQIISQMAMDKAPDVQSTYFSKIATQSGEMMEKLSDIVWSLKSEENSQENLLMKMYEFAGEILEPAGIGYDFEGEAILLNNPLPLEKRKNIFLIFKEALNNAAKYSKADQIQIQFSKQGDLLRMHISDDGLGFDSAEIKPGNGLQNMQQRAEKISGTARIKSQKNQGTTILFELPLT